MKKLVQTQPEQVASSTAKKPQYPILWVSDLIDASNSYLSGLFDIRGFEEIGDYIATDAQHYIVDTGASEEIIKAIAWTVGECSIWHCESKLPLSYLAPDHATSIEVTYLILMRITRKLDCLSDDYKACAINTKQQCL